MLKGVGSRLGTTRGGRFIALAALIAVALAVWFALGLLARVRDAGTIRASGTLEATESDVSPKVEGRLIDLRAIDGHAVHRGQVLAVLESVQPSLDLAQARANVAAASAQVAVAQAAYRLQRATYATTITQTSESVGIARSRLRQATENYGIEAHTATLNVSQAQAQMTAAQSAFARAKSDLARTTSLVATGDEAQQTLDDATAAFAGARAQLAVARDQVADAQANLHTVTVRQLDVVASQQAGRQSVAALQNARAQAQLVTERHAQALAAQAQLAQARAALGLAQNNVDETQLIAPFDGYVVSHNFEDGDLIQPGAPVVTVGDLDHPYAYVYIPETDFPRVHTGMRAQVTLDGLPGHTFVGTVTEISTSAEFTPANVQTQEERIEYLVFRIKIQFTDRTGYLKPGLPIDAVLHV